MVIVCQRRFWGSEGVIAHPAARIIQNLAVYLSSPLIKSSRLLQYYLSSSAALYQLCHKARVSKTGCVKNTHKYKKYSLSSKYLQLFKYLYIFLECL